MKRTAQPIIESIEDAIGHPVTIDDYVTAVFYSGEVSLFKVSGFKQKRGRRGWGNQTIHAELQRLERTNTWQEGSTNANIFKTSNQITWVDPNWVMMHFLIK